MKRRYILNSEQGVNFWAQRVLEPEPLEVGAEVELELDEEQEQALFAAEWLKPAPAKKPKEA